MDAVDTYVPHPERDLTSPFMLPIDNAFLLPGRGTVIVGTLIKGVIKKNDEAELLGFDLNLKTTVTDIQVFKKSVAEVTSHVISYLKHEIIIIIYILGQSR